MKHPLLGGVASTMVTEVRQKFMGQGLSRTFEVGEKNVYPDEVQIG
jgi:hypothetical protein